MGNILIFGIVILVLVFIIKFFENREGAPDEKVKSKYLYQRKQWFMSKNEHEVFDVLISLVGQEYYVFPQVKIDKILDWKGNGKNSIYAMRHINQKSVDFLLCDKKYLNPRLAIELDDITHEREDRKERDGKVESIFASANYPLLRMKHSDLINSAELKEKILMNLNNVE